MIVMVFMTNLHSLGNDVFLRELENIEEVWHDGDSKFLSDFPLLFTQICFPFVARHRQIAPVLGDFWEEP